VSTLQSWLRRARLGTQVPPHVARSGSAASPISLLEVELGGSHADRVGEARYEIELGNGTRLRLPRPFVEEDVRRLLGLLQEAR
jgi:hypothetical protein